MDTDRKTLLEAAHETYHITTKLHRVVAEDITEKNKPWTRKSTTARTIDRGTHPPDNGTKQNVVHNHKHRRQLEQRMTNTGPPGHC